MSRHPERYFDPDPALRRTALQLYEGIAGLPLICPHGHVDPRLFADPDYRFGSPTELLLTPDHYIFRMLYSRGVSLDALGIPRRDGAPVEADPRRAWQVFAEHFYLFRGTPTGIWLGDELDRVFGIDETLNGQNAQAIYDAIDGQLQAPEFSPRRLYESFHIEVLCTTDAATDPLDHHRAIRESGWGGRILPSFRPDALVNFDTEGWQDQLDALRASSGIDIADYGDYIQALELRREYFKRLGAKASDHAAPTPYSAALSRAEAEAIFQRAMRGQIEAGDAERFTGHMLIEMARMSSEDGLVMQLHVGSCRNHNEALFAQRGRDMGADIPLGTTFTQNLRPLLNAFGADPRLTLILFTLDESSYSRELAPLAGHYPALRLGPPWWFLDSLNGMRRYFDQVIETAGLYNTCGFNDDTRAYLSIPARHDLWRRSAANWVAGLLLRHVIDEVDAQAMIRALAYELAKEAYRL